MVRMGQAWGALGDRATSPRARNWWAQSSWPTEPRFPGDLILPSSGFSFLTWILLPHLAKEQDWALLCGVRRRWLRPLGTGQGAAVGFPGPHSFVLRSWGEGLANGLQAGDEGWVKSPRCPQLLESCFSGLPACGRSSGSSQRH